MRPIRRAVIHRIAINNRVSLVGDATLTVTKRKSLAATIKWAEKELAQ